MRAHALKEGESSSRLVQKHSDLGHMRAHALQVALEFVSKEIACVQFQCLFRGICEHTRLNRR